MLRRSSRYPVFSSSLYSISLHENQPKSKMGAEKVSMNIVVVGQVQSFKAINTVAKATPATSQLMCEMKIIDKRGDDDDCYRYMRLTHALAVCWGLPITRRRTGAGGAERDGDPDVVRGHRYAFDWRVVPVWLAYAALDAFIMYYNYLEASGYVGTSLRKCFEESYCFAVIELANRNLGPFSALACSMFYGRRHKAAALAGTERVLAFIRDTDRDAATKHYSAALLSPVAKYYSAALVAAYAACIWLYTAAVPAAVIFPYCVNALSQTAIYNLVTFQYSVLGNGYARIDRLLEVAMDALGHRGRRSLAARVARLARASDDFGRQVGHLNRAYAMVLLLKWPYSVVRITMVVFRIIELSATVQDGRPFARVAAVLIIEHVGEILLFLIQLSYFCYTGARLSSQATVLTSVAGLDAVRCRVVPLCLPIQWNTNTLYTSLALEFSGEMQIASDSYGYMRLTHILAICWGMPITRRQIAADDVKGKIDSADIHEGKPKS
ncbi:hypothetical protein ACI65C_007415 [Semiaphis heraclei]